MRAIAFLALCVVAVSAIPANPQRIIGGSVTTIEAYPHIVALLYNTCGTVYQQSCAGTILNHKSILTAAHCSFGGSVTRWRIRVGSTWANSGGAVHNLSRIKYNNFNQQTGDSDVAIMRVTGTIIYSNSVRPASIAGSNYNLADNQPVWAVGWGRTSVVGPSSEQLRHVQTWTINQAACETRYANTRWIITNNMLCIGWLDVGGRDQCNGDSGGPLHHNGIVVGICSFSMRCADPYFPGINSRVSRFTSWIQANA